MCPVCKSSVSEHGVLCSECWLKVNWISNPKCHVCGYPFPANLDLGNTPMCPTCAAGNNELDQIRSACVYDDFSRDIILPFKYASRLDFTKIMSRPMINLLHEFPDIPDIILPVPLANRRLFKRGYNQATILAKPIAKHLNRPISYNDIHREYRSDMGHKTAAQRRVKRLPAVSPRPP